MIKPWPNICPGCRADVAQLRHSWALKTPGAKARGPWGDLAIVARIILQNGSFHRIPKSWWSWWNRQLIFVRVILRLPMIVHVFFCFQLCVGLPPWNGNPIHVFEHQTDLTSQRRKPSWFHPALRLGFTILLMLNHVAKHPKLAAMLPWPPMAARTTRQVVTFNSELRLWKWMISLMKTINLWIFRYSSHLSTFIYMIWIQISNICGWIIMWLIYYIHLVR